MTSHFQSLQQLWGEQSAATKRIRARFGLQKALDYLVGEKLFTFLWLADRDPIVAAEMPVFAAAIRSLFTPAELLEYLDELQRKRVILRQETEASRRSVSRRFTRYQLEALLRLRKGEA